MIVLILWALATAVWMAWQRGRVIQKVNHWDCGCTPVIEQRRVPNGTALEPTVVHAYSCPKFS